MGTLEKSEIVKRTIEPAIEYIRSIKPSDRIIIFYHNDCDGCCSAAIMSILIKKILGINSKLLPSDIDEDILAQSAIEKIGSNYEHLIVLDFPTFKIKERPIGKSILVLDHHPPQPLSGALYCNPRLFEPSTYMPVSYLMHHIYKSLADSEDVCWIAAAGTLGDYNITDCLDLFIELKKLRPELIDDVELSGSELYEKSLLGKIVEIVDASRVVAGNDGVDLATRFLIKTRDYKQLLEGTTPEAKEMLSFFERSENEIKRLIEDFKLKAEKIGRVVFYEVVSPLKIKSALATRIQRHSNAEVIVLAQKWGKTYNISLRRGSGSTIDLNRLFKEAVSNIPNSRGGGHEGAAGGSIPVNFLDTFLENLRGSV